jgi:alkylation response protein AidB-like acyl-CoA dehydrogenase
VRVCNCVVAQPGFLSRFQLTKSTKQLSRKHNAHELPNGLSRNNSPIQHFGSKELQKRIIPAVLAGEKTICLAITEPSAGSDVADLKTVARKTPCGKSCTFVSAWCENSNHARSVNHAFITHSSLHSFVLHLPSGKFYIVNGEKKWITNGTFADYFTTAVRTGGEGAMGVSLLVIPRSAGGVKTKQMQCSGVWGS